MVRSTYTIPSDEFTESFEKSHIITQKKAFICGGDTTLWVTEDVKLKNKFLTEDFVA